MDVSNFAALSQKLSKTRSILATNKRDESDESVSLHAVPITAASPPSPTSPPSPAFAPTPDTCESNHNALIPALNIRDSNISSTYAAPSPHPPKRIPIKSVGTVREMYRNMRKEADSLSMQKHRRNVSKLRTSLNSFDNTPKMPLITDEILPTSEVSGEDDNIPQCVTDLHYGRYCVDSIYKNDILQAVKQYLRDGRSVRLCARFNDTSSAEEAQASHDARQILKAIFYVVQALTCHDLMPVIGMRDDVLYVVLDALIK